MMMLLLGSILTLKVSLCWYIKELSLYYADLGVVEQTGNSGPPGHNLNAS